MRIRREHDLGADEARLRVAKVAAGLERQFSLKSEWRGDELHFRGAGAKGKVSITDDSIEFNVELGFALMMMEPAIRSAINTALDEHIVG